MRGFSPPTILSRSTARNVNGFAPALRGGKYPSSACVLTADTGRAGQWRARTPLGAGKSRGGVISRRDGPMTLDAILAAARLPRASRSAGRLGDACGATLVSILSDSQDPSRWGRPSGAMVIAGNIL